MSSNNSQVLGIPCFGKSIDFQWDLFRQSFAGEGKFHILAISLGFLWDLSQQVRETPCFGKSIDLPKWAGLSPDTLDMSSNNSQVLGIPCFGKSIDFQWDLFRQSFAGVGKFHILAISLSFPWDLSQQVRETLCFGKSIDLPKWAGLSPDTLDMSSNNSQVLGIPCFGKSIDFQWDLFRQSFAGVGKFHILAISLGFLWDLSQQVRETPCFGKSIDLPKWAGLSPDTLDMSSNNSQVLGIPCFGKSIDFQWDLF